MVALRGGCACGEVRYVLEGPPLIVHCCHCRDCQRQLGSAFAVNAVIEASRVTVLSGDLETVSMPTDSGRPHDIIRCAKCHTPLWSDYGRRGYLYFVRVGTLDDPDAVPPDVNIYTRSKLNWVQLDPRLPAFEEFYDMKAVWPEEMQARRKAASDAAKAKRSE